MLQAAASPLEWRTSGISILTGYFSAYAADVGGIVRRGIRCRWYLIACWTLPASYVGIFNLLGVKIKKNRSQRWTDDALDR